MSMVITGDGTLYDWGEVQLDIPSIPPVSSMTIKLVLSDAGDFWRDSRGVSLYLGRYAQGSLSAEDLAALAAGGNPSLGLRLLIRPAEYDNVVNVNAYALTTDEWSPDGTEVFYLDQLIGSASVALPDITVQPHEFVVTVAEAGVTISIAGQVGGIAFSYTVPLPTGSAHVRLRQIGLYNFQYRAVDSIEVSAGTAAEEFWTNFVQTIEEP